ncbi:MAG: hypothetical protein ABL977_11005, partial [Candidatus Eisenbacteria bacterium]
MISAISGGLAAIVAVVVVALLMRRGKSDEASTNRPSYPEPARGSGRDVEEQDGDAADDEGHESGDDADEGHIIAVTSDGEALVPLHHAVCLIPP